MTNTNSNAEPRTRIRKNRQANEYITESAHSSATLRAPQYDEGLHAQLLAGSVSHQTKWDHGQYRITYTGLVPAFWTVTVPDDDAGTANALAEAAHGRKWNTPKA